MKKILPGVGLGLVLVAVFILGLSVFGNNNTSSKLVPAPVITAPYDAGATLVQPVATTPVPGEITGLTPQPNPPVSITPGKGEHEDEKNEKDKDKDDD